LDNIKVFVNSFRTYGVMEVKVPGCEFSLKIRRENRDVIYTTIIQYLKNSDQMLRTKIWSIAPGLELIETKWDDLL
jgi:hypothetical protein